MDKPAGGYVRTLSEVAQAMDAAVSTVNNWRREGMPGEKGKWHLPTIAKWDLERKLKSGKTKPSGEVQAELELDGDMEFWETEFRKYRALRNKLDYEQRQGELVEMAEVEAAFVARAAQARSMLLSLGATVSTDPIVVAKIDAEVRRILENLAAPGLPGVTDEFLDSVRAWVSHHE